jgi:hypothetical protein
MVVDPPFDIIKHYVKHTIVRAANPFVASKMDATGAGRVIAAVIFFQREIREITLWLHWLVAEVAYHHSIT